MRRTTALRNLVRKALRIAIWIAVLVVCLNSDGQRSRCFRLLGGSSTRRRRCLARCRACAAQAWRRRLRLIALQRKALAVEHRGLAGPLAFDQHGADFRRRRGIVERAGDQPQLHAEPVVAFLDHDDRPQRRQRRIRLRFQQPAPQRAQAADRIGAAEIDAEFGSLDRELGRRFGGIRLGVARRRADATTSGIGAAVTVFAGASVRSALPAARIGRRHASISRPSAAWPGVAAGGDLGVRPVGDRWRPSAGAGSAWRRRSARGFSGRWRPRPLSRPGDDRSRRARLARRRLAARPSLAQAGPGGGLRRGRGRVLPGDRAGHRIQPLFQHGDAGVQPVAIAVQGIDGGGQPPRLVLAFPGDGLDLLRLPRQIGGRDLVAPPSDRGLVGEHRHDHRADRRRRPTIRAATARGGRTRPPRPKSRTARRRYSRCRSRQPDGRYPWPYDVCRPSRGPPKSRGKH